MSSWQFKNYNWEEGRERGREGRKEGRREEETEREGKRIKYKPWEHVFRSPVSSR